MLKLTTDKQTNKRKQTGQNQYALDQTIWGEGGGGHKNIKENNIVQINFTLL